MLIFTRLNASDGKVKSLFIIITQNPICAMYKTQSIINTFNPKSEMNIVLFGKIYSKKDGSLFATHLHKIVCVALSSMLHTRLHFTYMYPHGY